MAVRFRSALARFVSDENGQGTLEYVLLLTFCIISAGALFRRMMEMMDSGFQIFGAQLERDLKSGRSPLSVWKN